MLPQTLNFITTRYRLRYTWCDHRCWERCKSVDCNSCMFSFYTLHGWLGKCFCMMRTRRKQKPYLSTNLETSCTFDCLWGDCRFRSINTPSWSKKSQLHVTIMSTYYTTTTDSNCPTCVVKDGAIWLCLLLLLFLIVEKVKKEIIVSQSKIFLSRRLQCLKCLNPFLMGGMLNLTYPDLCF